MDDPALACGTAAPPRANGATRASVVERGSFEDVGARYAAAQWPCRKNEDRVHVSGAIPGLCDAVVQLYDSHGGKYAGQFCVDQLVPAIEEAFFSAPSHTRFARDRDALLAPEFLDKHGFHRGFDDAVVRAFARVDEEVKADHPSGTTAALLFAKKNADGDVCVKIAWCGDSRAVIARDHDLARILDLTRDHKPEDESEQRRIESHYRRIAGDDSYGRSHAYSPSPEASTRAGTRGMPAVEVKIGHRDLFASFEANREEKEETDEKSKSFRRQDSAGEIVDEPPTTTTRARTRAQTQTRRASAVEITDVVLAEMRASASTPSLEVIEREGESERGATTPSETPRTSLTTFLRRAERFPDELNDASQEEEEEEEEGEARDVAAALPAHAHPAFDRSRSGKHGAHGAGTQMSFVGCYVDAAGKSLSRERVFSSSGDSHGVSRSIGDRGAARACVSAPEINNVRIPSGKGARIVVASDGVWDCFASAAAMKKMARTADVGAAASKLCAAARRRREYGGLAPDDISVIVLDVGEKRSGGGGGCFACLRGGGGAAAAR